MTTPRYLSRGDYEAMIARREREREKETEAIRSQPRVTRENGPVYGYVNLYAIHPDGQNAPELPQPWKWVPHLRAWFCFVESERAGDLETQARELFNITKG